MLLNKVKYVFVRERTFMKVESGRTMVEIIAVLTIMGLLSITGVLLYSIAMRHQKVDEMLNTLQLRIIEIDSAMQGKNFTDTKELDKFLSDFTTFVAGHTISFYASPDNKGFIARFSHLNGDTIKGGFCRELMTKIIDQKFVSDVDFSAEDEDFENGLVDDESVRLNERVIDLDAICGG